MFVCSFSRRVAGLNQEVLFLVRSVSAREATSSKSVPGGANRERVDLSRRGFGQVLSFIENPQLGAGVPTPTVEGW